MLVVNIHRCIVHTAVRVEGKRVNRHVFTRTDREHDTVIIHARIVLVGFRQQQSLSAGLRKQIRNRHRIEGIIVARTGKSRIEYFLHVAPANIFLIFIQPHHAIIGLFRNIRIVVCNKLDFIALADVKEGLIGVRNNHGHAGVDGGYWSHLNRGACDLSSTSIAAGHTVGDSDEAVAVGVHSIALSIRRSRHVAVTGDGACIGEIVLGTIQGIT